jgi:hypothetical protein
MKATKKIALLLAVFTIMAVLAMPLSASAAGNVHTATTKELATLCVMVEAANLTIKGLVKAAQYTPYNDVALLLLAVDCVVAPVFAYGEKIGVEVVCEYTEYEIDGQVVLVDPLRVINPPPKGDSTETKK